MGFQPLPLVREALSEWLTHRPINGLNNALARLASLEADALLAADQSAVAMPLAAIAA